MSQTTYLTAAERVQQRDQRQKQSKMLMRTLLIIYGLTLIVVLLSPLVFLNQSHVLLPHQPLQHPAAPHLDFMSSAD